MARKLEKLSRQLNTQFRKLAKFFGHYDSQYKKPNLKTNRLYIQKNNLDNGRDYLNS